MKRHQIARSEAAVDGQMAIDLLRRSLWVALEISGPILAVGLVVGVAVSLFAAVTQIQDMTLTFIPKLAAMAVTAALVGPWALKVMVGFAIELFRRAGELGLGAR